MNTRLHLVGSVSSMTRALLIMLVLSASAFAQDYDANSRYSLAPEQAAAISVEAAAPTTPPGEPLLSYRREEGALSSDGSTLRGPQAVAMRAAPADTEANPLRRAAEIPLAGPASQVPAAGVELPATSDTTASAAPPATDAAPAAFPPTAYALPGAPLLPPLQDAAAPAPTAANVSGNSDYADNSAAPTPIAPPFAKYDAAVQPAVHKVEDEPAPATKSDDLSTSEVLLQSASAAEMTSAKETDSLSRRLAPRSSAQHGGETDSAADKSAVLPFAFSKLASLSTAGAGLAIVVGLFLVCAWAMRKNGGTPPGGLPEEAFKVLGRAPLTPQCSAHLLRLGNKLVLVAMSAEGIQPLTEVTDGMEVDRLTGMCANGRGHGPSAEFQQVLEKLSREPARGFLGAEAANRRRSYAA